LPLPLVERSEKEIQRRIKRSVEAVKAVSDCRQIFITWSRKKPNVHLHLWLHQALAFEQLHTVSEEIERAVRVVLPNARVSLRIEPRGADYESIWKLVKDVAEKQPGSRGAHNIHVVVGEDGRISIDFHLEVGAGMTVQEAHRVAMQLEQKLKEADSSISEVIIHEESVVDVVYNEKSGTGTQTKSYIEHVARRFPGIKLVRRPTVLHSDERGGGRLHVILKCALDPALSVEKANELTAKFERELKIGNPKISRIDISEEPDGKGHSTREHAKSGRD
jgi:divalent metal cation (Fe/Co/Zn/Cd) transporter